MTPIDQPAPPAEIGTSFYCVEQAAVEELTNLQGPVVMCVNEPPWSTWSAAHRDITSPFVTVVAWNMDLVHLTEQAADITAMDPDAIGAATVVGFGGGTALDTAKFMAWKFARPLVQIPTITSVDAGFTDAIGVRDGGRVRYIGKIIPEKVVIDVELVRSAPKRLNRAGIGDILSCHTGLFDWRLAADAGEGHRWDRPLAALGTALLDELDAAADEIAVVSADGVRFLADAYRRIGAACAHAGHSRFEEGSEHFWAYAYEHATGAHLVHGELIAFAVCALAHVQGNDPERAASIVSRSMARAHPTDLGISESDFRDVLIGLRSYARSEQLDVSIVDLRSVDDVDADAAWAFVSALPRRGDD